MSPPQPTQQGQVSGAGSPGPGYEFLPLQSPRGLRPPKGLKLLPLAEHWLQLRKDGRSPAAAQAGWVTERDLHREHHALSQVPPQGRGLAPLCFSWRISYVHTFKKREPSTGEQLQSQCWPLTKVNIYLTMR